MLQDLTIDGRQTRIDIDADKLLKCPQCGSTEVVAGNEEAGKNKPGLRFSDAGRDSVEAIDCLGCGRQFTPYEDPDIAKLVHVAAARSIDEAARLKAIDRKFEARLTAVKPIPGLFCIIYAILGISSLAYHFIPAGIAALIFAFIFYSVAKPRKQPNDPEYLKLIEKKALQ